MPTRRSWDSLTVAINLRVCVLRLSRGISQICIPAQHRASRCAPRHRELVGLLGFDPEADPPKLLYICPDCSGNFLEVIVLQLADDRELVIHATPLRPVFHQILPKGYQS